MKKLTYDIIDNNIGRGNFALSDGVTVNCGRSAIRLYFRGILPTSQCVHGTCCKTDGVVIYTRSVENANKCIEKYYAGKMQTREIRDEQSRLANALKANLARID